MLILAAATDAIEVVLGANPTTNADFFASWRDIDATTFVPGNAAGASNGTTTVDLVTGPGSGFYRVIDYISLLNRDAGAITVTLKFDANGTERQLLVVTIASGERIEYVDGQGFRVLANNGSIKHGLVQGTNPVPTGIQMVSLGADVVNNNGTANTIADVTGLSFPVTSGQRYWFRFCIHYNAAATSTGSRWSINGPTTTDLNFESGYSLTTTTRTVNTGLSAYDTPAGANATSAATGSNIAIIEGFILPSENGNVIARFASEISASAITALRGSIVEYAAVG